MTPRRIASLAALVVLGASGLYVGVYLYRWEWNRALIAGMFFLIAEVGLGITMVLDRLRRIEDRTVAAASQSQVLTRLRETAPAPRDHFGWLDPGGERLGVFVPVLMGAGVIASALAWVVERLAHATARPVLERGLAARLLPLAWPEGDLTTPASDPADLLTGPRPAR